jgi:hypothetical protein
MQFSEVDTYIAKFEELARQARYTAGNLEMMHTFIKGLTLAVLEDVFKPLHMQMYHMVKQKAIECTRSRVLLDNILRARQPGGRGFQGGMFQGFQRGNYQRQPFFSRQNASSNMMSPTLW